MCCGCMVNWGAASQVALCSQHNTKSGVLITTTSLGNEGNHSVVKATSTCVHTAMMGSIYKGYNNGSSQTAEYNVKLCPDCADQLLRAGWNICITPIDTGKYNTLSPDLEKELLSGTNMASLSLADIFLYGCFTSTVQCMGPVRSDPPILFDPVATFLLYPNASSYIIFQELKLSVNSTGYTVINNSSGTPVDVALYWQEPNGLYNFQQYMVNVLSNSTYK